MTSNVRFMSFLLLCTRFVVTSKAKLYCLFLRYMNTRFRLTLIYSHNAYWHIFISLFINLHEIARCQTGCWGGAESSWIQWRWLWYASKKHHWGSYHKMGTSNRWGKTKRKIWVTIFFRYFKNFRVFVCIVVASH